MLATANEIKLTVNVTAQNIAEGSWRSGCYCPVALAIRDALAAIGKQMSTYLGITVGEWNGRVRIATLEEFTFTLPPEAGSRIRRFDADIQCGMEPFSFELTLVPYLAG